MGAHGCHPGTATDKHHFVLGLLGKEFTEGPVNLHFVSGFKVERPTRHDPGRNTLTARRRGCNPDIELNDPFFLRVVGHRVSSNGGVGASRFNIKEPKSIPVAEILLLHMEVTVLH